MERESPLKNDKTPISKVKRGNWGFESNNFGSAAARSKEIKFKDIEAIYTYNLNALETYFSAHDTIWNLFNFHHNAVDSLLVGQYFVQTFRNAI